jgi:hypothetical protein
MAAAWVHIPAGGVDVGARLVAGMAMGLADEDRRQAEAESGEGHAEEERVRSEPRPGGDEAGREGGDRHRAIPGGLVEPHGEAAAVRPDEVDLHDHRGRPGEALVDAEQHVGEDNPRPARSERQQERHRDTDEPSGHQRGLAPDAIRQGARDEVGGGLHHAEGEDVRQRSGEGVQVEHLGADERQHGAFLPDHPSDQGVHADEQRELSRLARSPSCGGAELTRPSPDACRRQRPSRPGRRGPR